MSHQSRLAIAAMSSLFWMSIGSHLAAIAVGAFAATTYLSFNSGNHQSLADYISALCTNRLVPRLLPRPRISWRMSPR